MEKRDELWNDPGARSLTRRGKRGGGTGKVEVEAKKEGDRRRKHTYSDKWSILVVYLFENEVLTPCPRMYHSRYLADLIYYRTGEIGQRMER